MPTPTRYKIAQVLSSVGMGGRELAPLLLGKGLHQKKWDVTFWCAPKSFLAERVDQGKYASRPFHHHGPMDPRSIFEILSALKKDKPDLIHLHKSGDLWSVVPAIVLADWKGKLVLTKHVESNVKKKDPLHQWLYRRVDRIWTCSDFIRRNVIETCPIPPEKVQTSFMPADLGFFRYDPVGRKKIRKVWGWDKNPVVGMASRLSPGKGHELFLKTAARILRMDPKVRFRVAGTFTPDEAWFQRELFRIRKDLGLEGTFAYDDYVPDLPQFLSGLDLFVHMADRESFGMAVVEAMACGKPVVVRKGGGVQEILKNSSGKYPGGVVFDSNDPEEWAVTLERILRDKGLMAKFQKESRKMARRFDLNQWVDHHLEWYRELCGR